ncbi:DNA primase [Alicyclobacillus sp. SO9]|uniref:DNA primase n=1 Tax=Alicyclobacillus sp. SO9 TaxID=2665646 RepID=UPI0018E73F09|nr:DNA primase [Alicyclobacillus sp. SO9]QQE77326.1 DNA primase [Alicyclobacillus sp. SO9]
MALIPDWFVDEVRQRTDIVDVVSEHVQLRRTGRSFVGLCPFHSERTPSFSVSADRQLYHCFGCGTGGTVIHFVMEIEGVEFTQAVTLLAERAQLEIPAELKERTQVQVPSEKNSLQRMRDAHELAAKLYNYILMNTSAGVQALKYLEERGISKQTAVAHQLGFAPFSNSTLTSFLQKRGFAVSVLTEAGLAVQMGEQVADRFRGRLIIPIANAKGQIVAFGGRAIRPDAKPKYLNSPETAIFHKGRILYNQYVARKEIRQTGTAVLLEGYMDVIAAEQAGVQNAMASLGTAFTEEQAAIIKRWANRLVLAYDGDEAGQSATVRAAEIAAAVDLDVRVAALPDGKDPDEFIREHGAAAFQRLLQEQTLTVVEFQLSRLRSHSDLRTSAGVNEFIRKALELLHEWSTPIEQETIIKALAKEFHVSAETLKEEYTLIAKRSTREHRKVRQTSRNFEIAQSQHRKLQRGNVIAANRLLQAALQSPAAATFLMNNEVMELVLPEQTALLAHLYAYFAEHQEYSSADLLEALEDAPLVDLASSLLMEDAPSTDEAVLKDYLRTIRLQEAEHKYKALLDESLRATQSGDRSLVEELKKQIVLVQRQIQQLKLPRTEL